MAAWFDDPRSPVEPESLALLEAAAAKLEEGGIAVDPDARPNVTLEESFDLFDTLLQAVLGAGHETAELDEWAAASGTDPLSHQQRRRAIRHRDWIVANEARLQMRLRWHEFFTNWDAILLPVMSCPAIPHDHHQPSAERVVTVGGTPRPYRDLLAWMAPAGACLLPATVVPVGTTTGGLPVGVQILGPYLHDYTTLALAKIITRIIGPTPPPAAF